MPVDGERGDELSEPIDRLVIALRAYVTGAPKKPKSGAKDKRCETRGGRVGDWKKYVPRVRRIVTAHTFSGHCISRPRRSRVGTSAPRSCTSAHCEWVHSEAAARCANAYL